MTATYDHVHTIHKLTEEFYQQIKFPFVQHFIPQPEMDPMQLELLLTLLEEAEVSSGTQYTVTLAALFIQAAMDTHDSIGTDRTDSETERKQRQLTVLAGDYYSSLYYKLLANAGETSYISIISKAVQEINDAKMRVREAGGGEDSFSHLVVAKSALVTHLAGYFNMSELIPSIQRMYTIQLLTKNSDSLFEAFAIDKQRIDASAKVGESYELLNSLQNHRGRFQNVIREEAFKMGASSV